MTATQCVTRRSTRKFSRESHGSPGNLYRQTRARAVPAASLYGNPENCPMSRIRTRYSLTCPFRSSAARANPLISRVFFTQSSMSRHAVPSLRRSRYSSTPAAPWCLSCLVCDRVRSLAQVEPLRPARTMEKACSLRNTAVCRSCAGANTCPRFQGVVDVKVRRKVRRKAIHLTGVHLAYFLQAIRAGAHADRPGAAFPRQPGRDEDARTAPRSGHACVRH